MTSIQSEPVSVNFNLDTEEDSEDVIIDHSTFDQLIGICQDDDDDGKFLRTLIDDYFRQAEMTHGDMEVALAEKDFSQLSRLGHFLKGSSAALGIVRVKESCERLENYGQFKNEDGTITITQNEAEAQIRELLEQIRLENEEAETYLEPYCEGLTEE